MALETVTPAIAHSLVDVLFGNSGWFGKSKKSLEEKKMAIVKELSETGVDPMIFDSLLSNEINRRLKVNFGVTFIVLTFIFTTASYLVIIFNSLYKWDISQVSITALIIETPIQLIGILFIIARNLFPVKG